MIDSGLSMDSRLFDGLASDERRAWVQEATRRVFNRHAVVVRQGDRADWFYLVESGFLKLVQLSPDGHEVIVRFAGPGELLGGLAAIEGARYPITATAVERAHLIGWPAPVLQGLLRRYPQVQANIMREMARHMTDALTRARELATTRVSHRLAHALLRLMRQCGRRIPAGTLLVHSLTRQEMAELTGTTLYTVSRTLSQWTAEGILGSQGRRIVIRDAGRLEQLATGNGEPVAQ